MNSFERMGFCVPWSQRAYFSGCPNAEQPHTTYNILLGLQQYNILETNNWLKLTSGSTKLLVVKRWSSVCEEPQSSCKEWSSTVISLGAGVAAALLDLLRPLFDGLLCVCVLVLRRLQWEPTKTTQKIQCISQEVSLHVLDIIWWQWKTCVYL